MNEEEAMNILNKSRINYSSQLVELAVKFNSKKLLNDFCAYWKSKPAGGGDLGYFLTNIFKEKLGDD